MPVAQSLANFGMAPESPGPNCAPLPGIDAIPQASRLQPLITQVTSVGCKSVQQSPCPIQRYKQPNIHSELPAGDSPLLPPQEVKYHGKKTLILDLDETLVHSSFQPTEGADVVLPVNIEGQIFYVYVAKRPGIDEFLARMNKLYEVVIYTASLAIYADPLLDIIDPQKLASYRLFREHCTFHNNVFVKDLTRMNRDLKDTIIVDNSPAAYVFQPQNAIPILTWINDKSDRKLSELAPVLELLAEVADVRKSIGQIVRLGASDLDYKVAAETLKKIACPVLPLVNSWTDSSATHAKQRKMPRDDEATPRRKEMPEIPPARLKLRRKIREAEQQFDDIKKLVVAPVRKPDTARPHKHVFPHKKSSVSTRPPKPDTPSPAKAICAKNKGVAATRSSFSFSSKESYRTPKTHRPGSVRNVVASQSSSFKSGTPRPGALKKDPFGLSGKKPPNPASRFYTNLLKVSSGATSSESPKRITVMRSATTIQNVSPKAKQNAGERVFKGLEDAASKKLEQYISSMDTNDWIGRYMRSKPKIVKKGHNSPRSLKLDPASEDEAQTIQPVKRFLATPVPATRRFAGLAHLSQPKLLPSAVPAKKSQSPKKSAPRIIQRPMIDFRQKAVAA